MSVAADTFAFVAELVARRSAIRLEPGKEYLVESRLGPLARAQGLSVDGFVRRLRSGVAEAELVTVVEAMTTNETSFLRDVAPFAALRSHVLPLLRAAGSADRIRVWSAACSTGQEPYSIVMALADGSPGAPQVDVLATDLSEQVLERARTGVYSQLEINRGLPAPMLVRHFDRVGAQWQVRAELRERVTFRRHNLMDPAPPGPFDLVFLRNVLIYFDLATKRAVLDRVARVLRPGGFVVLGAAETTLGVHEGYERVEAGRAVLHRPVAVPAAPAATGPLPAVPAPFGSGSGRWAARPPAPAASLFPALTSGGDR